MIISKVKKTPSIIEMFFLCCLMFISVEAFSTEVHPLWLQTELDKADKLNDKDPNLSFDFIKTLIAQHENELKNYDLAALYSRLGTYHFYFGQYEQSLKLLNKSKKLLKTLNNRIGVSILLTHGMLLDSTGKASESEELFYQAIKISKEIEDLEILSDSYAGLAGMYDLNHNDVEALKYYQKAYVIVQELNDELDMAYLNTNMASVYANLKDFNKAISLQNTAITYFQNNDYKYDEMLAHYSQAVIYKRDKQFERALVSYNKMLALSLEFNEPNKVYFANIGISMLYLKLANFEKAQEYWLQAEQLFPDIEGPYSKAHHYLVKAQLEVNDKNTKLAFNTVSKAQKIIFTLDQDKNLDMYSLLYDVKIDIAVLEEDYKTAFELQKEEKRLNDKYQNAVREEARSKYKVMFDTEQTLLKNKLLESDKQFSAIALENANQEQQLKNMIIITAVLFIAVLFFFFYRQIRTSKKLNRLANTDVLTQLANRRYTFSHSELELKKSINNGTAFSIIIFDIDHFKKVNDTYGHAGGDEVLINTAKTANKFFREQDVLGRIGGEEFLAILSNTSLSQALEVAQRIREAIEAQSVTFEDKTINITASFGVAQFSPDREDFISLFQHADEYLYKAKNQGRNCIVSE